MLSIIISNNAQRLGTPHRHPGGGGEAEREGGPTPGAHPPGDFPPEDRLIRETWPGPEPRHYHLRPKPSGEAATGPALLLKACVFARISEEGHGISSVGTSFKKEERARVRGIAP